MDWDPMPPTPHPRPDSEWGIGEDADLITLLPIFDAKNSRYVNRGHVFNYPEGVDPPRRSTIVTFYRLSNRLLMMMDLENKNGPGRHMGSEMWPQTVALHHGLKAVYAPHSIYMSRQFPAKAANYIFNHGDSKFARIHSPDEIAYGGEGSGGPDGPFGWDREFNFFDTGTWYYRANLAPVLYDRWRGKRTDGVGGADWEARHGTYCLPPMLLHPIKDVGDVDLDPVEVEMETEQSAAERIARACAAFKALPDSAKKDAELVRQGLLSEPEPL